MFDEDSLSQSDLRMLMLAVEVAEASKCRQQVGAVMIDHRGITTSVNRDHRWGDKIFPWSVHAELGALKGHCKRGGRLYVARLTPGGAIGMAKPCPRCAERLQVAGIARVTWTTNTGVDSARCRELSTDLNAYYELSERETPTLKSAS